MTIAELDVRRSTSERGLADGGRTELPGVDVFVLGVLESEALDDRHEEFLHSIVSLALAIRAVAQAQAYLAELVQLLRDLRVFEPRRRDRRQARGDALPHQV